jgi:hypothetical protein
MWIGRSAQHKEGYCDGIWQFARQRLGERCIQAGIIAEAKVIFARQRLGKQLFPRQRVATKAFLRQHKRTEELCDMVISIRPRVSYKRQCIREFESSRDQFEISERFFREIRQTGVVQKQFNVWAVIINCNCKEAPINRIIKSGTHYYLSCKPLIRDCIFKLEIK